MNSRTRGTSRNVKITSLRCTLRLQNHCLKDCFSIFSPLIRQTPSGKARGSPSRPPLSLA